MGNGTAIVSEGSGPARTGSGRGRCGGDPETDDRWAEDGGSCRRYPVLPAVGCRGGGSRCRPSRPPTAPAGNSDRNEHRPRPTRPRPPSRPTAPPCLPPAFRPQEANTHRLSSSSSHGEGVRESRMTVRFVLPSPFVATADPFRPQIPLYVCNARRRSVSFPGLALEPPQPRLIPLHLRTAGIDEALALPTLPALHIIFTAFPSSPLFVLTCRHSNYRDNARHGPSHTWRSNCAHASRYQPSSQSGRHTVVIFPLPRPNAELGRLREGR